MESKSFNLAQDELPSWINTTLGELTIQGKFLELSEFCEQVIREYPNSIIIWNNLGNAYRQLQKFAEASNAFRKLLALNPTLSDGHSNLGATFQDILAFNVAIECYKTAICLDSNNLNAHYNMGLALKSQGKYRDAIICFNRALVLKNDFVDAHCNLADAYRCEGRLTEAKEAYNKAFSIQPENVFAKHMLDALKGQKTKAPPDQFVEQLFDQYAPTFDYELVEKLRYNLPAALGTLISNRENGFFTKLGLEHGIRSGFVFLIQVDENWNEMPSFALCSLAEKDYSFLKMVKSPEGGNPLSFQVGQKLTLIRTAELSNANDPSFFDNEKTLSQTDL